MPELQNISPQRDLHFIDEEPEDGEGLELETELSSRLLPRAVGSFITHLYSSVGTEGHLQMGANLIKCTQLSQVVQGTF